MQAAPSSEDTRVPLPAFRTFGGPSPGLAEEAPTGRAAPEPEVEEAGGCGPLLLRPTAPHLDGRNFSSSSS